MGTVHRVRREFRAKRVTDPSVRGTFQFKDHGGEGRAADHRIFNETTGAEQRPRMMRGGMVRAPFRGALRWLVFEKSC